MPCEAVRVAKKHRGWFSQRSELRAAMDTLIGLVEAAHDDVQRERLAEFGRLVDQLEEPA